MVKPMKTIKYISVAFEDGSRHRIDPAGLCAACVSWLGLTVPVRGRKPGVTEESARQTALMVAMRVEDKLTLGQIGDIFGMTREAVRLRLKRAKVDGATQKALGEWRIGPQVLPMTPGRFAKRVREWVRESGCVYCPQGKHVVAPGELLGNGRICRECNRVRAQERYVRLHPGRRRRSAGGSGSGYGRGCGRRGG